ncbi:hypothetical protein [Saccharothrix xinjiangensis]|uniref:Uncharacterized protein n=1 Tax=Saccharothrix xinjiangensis TaxID=204798 RepID=A0ABV9Y213_9PSEU
MQHPAAEFTRHCDQQDARQHRADPREDRLTRFAADNQYLRDRLVEQAAELEELRRFRELAVSRLASRHDEIRARRRRRMSNCGAAHHSRPSNEWICRSRPSATADRAASTGGEV